MERPTREFVLQLMASKEAMETELRQYLTVLTQVTTHVTVPKYSRVHVFEKKMF